MIRSFRDRGTADVFHGKKSVLEDMRVPPGNRLEALKGDRKGEHSVRINQQYRVCFRWTQAGPENVQIVDYHA